MGLAVINAPLNEYCLRPLCSVGKAATHFWVGTMSGLVDHTALSRNDLVSKVARLALLGLPIFATIQLLPSPMGPVFTIACMGLLRFFPHSNTPSPWNEGRVILLSGFAAVNPLRALNAASCIAASPLLAIIKVLFWVIITYASANNAFIEIEALS